MTEAPLYQWPAAARLGRTVPKTRFYEHAAVPAAVRGKFVSDVQRITWAYKLAENTTQLRGDAAVPEIQIFAIDLKGADVGDDVLAAIDKAVQFPIIFEINSGAAEQSRTRMCAAYKQLAGASRRQTSYFSTRWQATDVPRVPLPAAVNLSGLYAGLLTPMLPIDVRPGEDLAAATIRVDEARKIERAIALLERKLRNEPQLKRKLELRREIRKQSDALAALAPATSTRQRTSSGQAEDALA